MESPAITSDVPVDTVRRITAAADQLYEEGGRAAFPNVDSVRRRARVNMNDASNIMRAWRRAQTAAARPLVVDIPLQVQEASQALLAAVWSTATQTANENLQAAQAGWELERAEAETFRRQLATAFDSQSEELAVVQQSMKELQQKLLEGAAGLDLARADLARYIKLLADAESAAAVLDARSLEQSRRADDLRNALDRAHAEIDLERMESKRKLEEAEAQIASLRKGASRKQ